MGISQPEDIETRMAKPKEELMLLEKNYKKNHNINFIKPVSTIPVVGE